MKQALLLSLLAATGAAQAVELYNNGPVAAGGPPALSVIRAGGTTLGLGAQTASGNSVAEDFVVGGFGWTVESIDFYGYQTGSTAFTFQVATWSIVSGDVNTGTVVASGATAVTNGGLQGYRVSATTLTNTQRGIYKAVADIPDAVLPAGNYYLRWSLTGSLASGPWQPPTSDGVVGDAFQSVTNGAFAPVVDAGDGLGMELPFTLNGTVTPVPESGTLVLMLAGGLGLMGALRRRQLR